MAINYWFGKAFANMLGGETAGESSAIDFLSDTIKCLLTTSSYTPNRDTHEFASDITNEVSGTGYSAGGATLASKTLTSTAANSFGTSWGASTAYAVGTVVKPVSGNGFLYRCVVAGTSAGSEPTWPTVVGQTVTDGGVTWVCAGRHILQIDAADPAWSTASFTARYAVIYKDTGSAATSPLMILVDLEGNQTVTAANFTIQFNAQGIIYVLIP